MAKVDSMDKSNAVKKVTLMGLWVVFLGALFYFYEYFLRVSPEVMQHDFMHTFKIGAAGFGTLSGFYFYAYTPMQLAVGIIIDKYSVRVILTVAVLLCAVGTLLIPISDIFALAAIGRFMQGMGSAFAFVSALKLAAMWLPASRFAFFAGACAALGYVGAASGEILLSVWVRDFGWRQSLFAFAILGVGLAIIFWLFLGAKPKASARKSRKVTPSLTWPQVGSQLLEIIKNGYIWWAGFLSFLLYLPTTVFAALWGVPYLMAMHHYTKEQAAVASGLIFVGWAIGSPLQGWISDVLRNRVQVMSVNALISFVFAVCVLYIQDLSYVTVCVLFVLMGISSSAQMLTFTMGRDVVNLRVVGMVIAFVNTLAMLGGTIFQSGFGVVLEMLWDGSYNSVGEKVYSLYSYQVAAAIVPICFIVAAVISFFIKDKN